jgi:hypothetical protein
MKRLLFLMAVLAVWLVPAHAGTVVWDRGPGAGGWLRGTDANAYGQGSGTYADAVVPSQALTFGGYVLYSYTYSTVPGYYQMRIWSDGAYWTANPGPWALLYDLTLTATSVSYLGQAGDYYHAELRPVYEITFAFSPISLAATELWPNGWEVPAIYWIGLTSSSAGNDAGQWFLADGPHGGVDLINDAGGTGTYFGGSYGVGQMGFQLLGSVDAGPGGSVPEPATVGFVALGFALAAGLRRAAGRAGAGR